MHGNIRPPLPSSVELLDQYQTLIELTSCFRPQSVNTEDRKETLRKAIRQIFDITAQRTLDLHLESFLKYIAKTESELFELLQLTANSCSTVSLTETALLFADAAYLVAMSGTCIDKQAPDEILHLPNSGRIELYSDSHKTSDAEATICFAEDNFLPSVCNYRSNRLHARSGPRMRRDCELVHAKIERYPWAIATRGYFLPFQHVIHCRTPFADSDVSLGQQLQIRDAYISALELAVQLKIKSIELPMMSVRGSRSTFEKLRRATIEAVHAAQKHTSGFEKICLIGCP